MNIIYPECIGKRHQGITDKLQLGLHIKPLSMYTFVPCAEPTEVFIVWCPRAIRVFALELLFPVLNKPRIPRVVFWPKAEKVILESFDWVGQRLHCYRTFYLRCITQSVVIFNVLMLLELYYMFILIN